MGKQIQFNNAALNKAASAAAGQVQGLSAALDEISEDIKRLEAWLQEHELCVPVSLHVSTRTWSGGLMTEKNFLKWDEKEGKWGLFYCSETCHLDHGPHYERLPLIKTPTEVRIRCMEFLPALVNVVRSRIGDTKPERLDLPAPIEIEEDEGAFF